MRKSIYGIKLPGKLERFTSKIRKMDNGWKRYWQERISSGGEYYGKTGGNADKIIRILKIGKKDKVLDIGCAVGAYLSDIRKKTGAKCYGIDISSIAIKLNKDKNLSLNVGDMEEIPFKDRMFDKVLSLGTFEHTPRSLKVFKELNRVMKIGGIAHISIPNKFSFFHITKSIKMLFNIWELGYEKSFTYEEINQLVKKSGFELKAFWVEPPTKIGKNPFNLLDKILNKVNNKKFGYFINIVVKKRINIK